MRAFIPRALQGLYFFCEPIAEGSFGHIYLAIHALTKQKVAVKILEKKRLGADAFRVRSEINALKTLSHPHIYTLYQVVETESYFYLIVEYIPGGELFDYILQQGSLQESEARSIFRQIVSAVGYAHAKGIAHRDLKPENILLDDDQNIRLIDFGLCAKNNENGYLSTFCGSLAYASPEVLASKEYNGHAADIWSMGVILYALLCGCLPFDPTKPEKLPKIISKGQYTVNEKLSKTSRMLLSRMLCVDPEARIKMNELCQHPWITGANEGPVELHLESKHMQFLNIAIVKEIAMYTRIPKIEMSRMLRRKSYDYLMATYLIMESFLMEQDTLLRLPRREHEVTQPENVSNSPVVEWEGEPVMTPRTHSSRIDTTCGPNLTKEFPFNIPPPPPMRTSSIEVAFKESVAPTRTVGLQTSLSSPVRDEASDDTNCSKLMTLSPGRSIDSQLNELTKSLRLKDCRDFNKAPSGQLDEMSKCETMCSDTRTFFSDSVEISQGSKLNSMPSLLIDSTADNQVSKMSTSSSGSRGTIGMFKHMFARRPSSSSRTASATDSAGHQDNAGNLQTPMKQELQKLRHVKQGNNIIYIRPGLTASEVLERIAESLHKNSIRFTLKRHGFTCTFANDWGQTQLSFELEAVNVSTKAIFPKLLLPKPFTTVSKRPPLSDIATTIPAKNGLHEPFSYGNLGVKMKRLQGDAFTYASICRMVLDQADVKVMPSAIS